MCHLHLQHQSPIYCFLTRYITTHNTAWICLDIFTMTHASDNGIPILAYHERHLGLSAVTLRDSADIHIFLVDWGKNGHHCTSERARDLLSAVHIQPDAPLEVALASDASRPNDRMLALRKRWLPASFVRFIWFARPYLSAC